MTTPTDPTPPTDPGIAWVDFQLTLRGRDDDGPVPGGDCEDCDNERDALVGAGGVR